MFKNSCFFSHKWGKWQYYEQDICVAPGFLKQLEQPIKGIEKRQRRQCDRCGKYQEEIIW